jgi:hypothetical protein
MRVLTGTERIETPLGFTLFEERVFSNVQELISIFGTPHVDPGGSAPGQRRGDRHERGVPWLWASDHVALPLTPCTPWEMI